MHRLHRAVGITALTLALLPSLTAQQLVRDFNTTPPSASGDSFPGPFLPLANGQFLMAATDDANGRELWTTDGTASGTQLLVDLSPGLPGSDPSQFVELTPGVYVFVATRSDVGRELWRTDGTAAGTFLLSDVRPGPASSFPANPTRVGNRIAFQADDGVHGVEVWLTDGTTAGTQMLMDIVPGPGSIGQAYSELVARGTGGDFVFQVRVGGLWQLWASNGTPGGTMALQTFGSLSTSLGQLTTYGNMVLFRGRTAIGNPPTVWVSDGTQGGTLSLGLEHSGAFQATSGYAYIRGYEPSTGYELWRTDGTVGGTQPVVELIPGGGFFGNADIWFLGELVGGDVAFLARDTTGHGLYRSDGTATGTARLRSIRVAGVNPGANLAQQVGSELWFSIPQAFGGGLFRTDGTAAGTSVVATQESGSVAPTTTLAGTLLLDLDGGTGVGREPHVTDGTAAGTTLLRDLSTAAISESSTPRVRATFGDRAVVDAGDTQFGRELWLTDGTPAGTQLLADLAPGAASPFIHGVAATERNLLFTADTPGTTGGLWIVDGTAAAPTPTLLQVPGLMSAARPAAFGDRFVFAGREATTGEEPWVTDGTVSGTSLLADILAGPPSSAPTRWFVLNDRLLFQVSGPTGWELWATDGTPAGTTLLTQVRANAFGGFIPFNPFEYGGRAWFANFEPTAGVELWSTDGTPAGTGFSLDLRPGAASSSPQGRAVIGGQMLVRLRTGGTDRLLVTDGTATNTTLLNQPMGSLVGPFAVNENVAVFAEQQSSGDYDLWRTDGTNAGTSFLRTIELSMFPETSGAGVDRLLLAMAADATGTELWSTDGSVAGTVRLFDLAPNSSNPSDITRVGDRLLFVADDGIHGYELFSMPFADTGDYAADVYGSGCAAGATPTIALGGAARVGQTFAFDLGDAPANTIAVLALSDRRGAVPIPGCTLRLGGALEIATVATDAQGDASLSATASPALLGARFDVQYFAFDSTGPAFGFLSATPGLEIVIGQ
ncbi:MAG: hypothetical protein AB8H80_21135 [Planctomycetota bacterium]